MAWIGYINCKLSTVKLGQTERHLLKLLSLHADIVCNSFLFCGFDCDRNQTELVLSKRALAKPSPAENVCSILSITQLGSRQDDQVQQSIDSEMSRLRLSLSLSLSLCPCQGQAHARMYRPTAPPSRDEIRSRSHPAAYVAIHFSWCKALHLTRWRWMCCTSRRAKTTQRICNIEN